jgi:predicted nucleotidyltransferase
MVLVCILTLSPENPRLTGNRPHSASACRFQRWLKKQAAFDSVLLMKLKFIIFASIMIETGQIRDIVNRIAQNYNPDKIILFGSYAHGNYSDDSDLDFILVKETNAPKHKRGIEVRRLFYGLTVPMDFKIYTSFEFQKELSNQYSFLSSAIKGSKVLYERKD